MENYILFKSVHYSVKMFIFDVIKFTRSYVYRVYLKVMKVKHDVCNKIKVSN